MAQTWKRIHSHPLQRISGCGPAVFFGKWCIVSPMQKSLYHSRFAFPWIPAVLMRTHTPQHRDLHWGQILVQNVPSSSLPKQNTTPPSMDDYNSGVITTIIDLGLSRMDASQTEVHWTPFEPEVFEGEGDYQFDIYRMMRDHNGDSWKEYRPLTNVMVSTPLLPAWVRIDWVDVLVASLPLAQVDFFKGTTRSPCATEEPAF